MNAKPRKPHKTAKTINAENVRLRVPLAYFGTEQHPLETPVFGAAYHREEGLYLIALADKNHVEVTGDTRIIVSYDPAAVPDVLYLRWCGNCSEAKANGRHLRRIGPDKYATAYCDIREKEYQEAYKAGRRFRKANDEALAKEREERIERAMSMVEKSKQRLTASVFRNIAMSTDYAHEDKKWARFDEVAAVYHMTREQAVELVEAVYPEVTLTQPKQAAS